MILLLVLFITITIFFMTFDLNSYKGIITSKASEALGRPVMINSMSMKLSLIPTIEIKGVKIVNNDAFKDEAPLLEIDSVDATLALLPLLQSKVEIKAFNMSTAKVNLIEKEGVNNYTFGTSNENAVEIKGSQVAQPQKDIFKSIKDVLSRLSIDTISVKTLVVTYTQDTKKQTLALMDVSIDQLKLVKMTIIYNGKTVKIMLNLGDFLSFVSRRPNYSFSATLDAFDTRVELSGTIGNTLNFSNMLFNLSVEGRNLKKVVDNFVKIDGIPQMNFGAKLIAKGDLNGQMKFQPLTAYLGDGSAALSADITLLNVKQDKRVSMVTEIQLLDAKLAAKYGIKPFSANIDVTGDAKNITLNKLTLSGGKSDVIMNGLLSLTEAIPTIKTQIVSRYFDLSDFIFDTEIEKSVQTDKNVEKKQTSLFSDEKIDLFALKKVNAEFAATAQYVKIPHLDNIGVAVSGDLKNGLLSIPSLTVRIPAGTIKGDVFLDTAQIPAKVNLNMQSDELKLDTVKVIAEQVEGVNVLTDLQLTTQGDTIKSFVSNLNGRIVLEMTKGEILNKWFNSLPVAMGILQNKDKAMNFAVTEQNSELVCGAVNLAIKNGVISSDNQIALETSVVDFSVSGQVDLSREELSLTMVPSLSNVKSSVQDALALTKIVKVSGPLMHPSFSVDAKAAVQTAVKDGLNVLVNKLAENKGIKSSEAVNSKKMHLCEKVLGRSLTGDVVLEEPSKVSEEVSQEKEEVVDTKDMIKQQLFDSLTKALKK